MSNFNLEVYNGQISSSNPVGQESITSEPDMSLYELLTDAPMQNPEPYAGIVLAAAVFAVGAIKLKNSKGHWLEDK